MSLRTTQLGAVVRLTGDPEVVVTQIGAFVRVSLVQIHSTQVGALIRLASAQARLSQLGALVRVTPVAENLSSGESVELSSPSTGSGGVAAGKSSSGMSSGGVVAGKSSPGSSPGGSVAEKSSPGASSIGGAIPRSSSGIPSGGSEAEKSSSSGASAGSTADKSSSGISAPQGSSSQSSSGGGGGNPSGRILAGLEFPAASAGGEFHPEEKFRVEFDDIWLDVPSDCTLHVVSYSASVRGGSEQAELRVEAKDSQSLFRLKKWLGKTLKIYNFTGQIVWVGFVSEIELGLEQYTLTGSLERMANRVAVIYEESSASGESIRQQTSYADNLESQQFFGFRKELLFSAGEAVLSQAELQRDQLLAELSWPVGAPTIQAFRGAKVRCEGLTRPLSWVLYSNPLGRVEHVGRTRLQTCLGWRWETEQVGFYKRKIFLFEDDIRQLFKGDRVRIEGTSSAANEGIFVVGTTSGEVVSLTSTGIYFDPADDLLHTDEEGWINFTPEYFILITGSPNNSGFHWVKRKADNTRLEISPGMSDEFEAESAGASITVQQSFTVEAQKEVVPELPGASVTFFSLSEKIAQSFAASGDMETGRLSLRLQKVGEGSDLLIKICEDSSGEPGTVLGSTSLTAGNISPFERDVWIDLPSITLSADEDYWILLETSALSSEDFLLLGVTDEPSGTTLGWDGETWEPLLREGKNLALEFRLWDLEDTSETMRRILDQCGQLLEGIDVSTTGVKRCQYADGTMSGLDEFLKLLAIGSTAGRLTAQVNFSNRRITVELEESVGESCPILQPSGKIQFPEGGNWGEGLLPVGRWLRLEGSPQETDPNWQLNPFYVDRAEYRVGSSPPLRVEPKFSRNLQGDPREQKGNEADALKPFLR